MNNYYKESLSGERLKKCYELAPPRIQQYLNAELDFVLRTIQPGDTVLEMGCGYGRVMPALCGQANQVVGIDTSLDNLQCAKEYLKEVGKWYLAGMDALQLGFLEDSFDCVVCIQNGVSAFHVDQRELIRESIRVSKPGGRVLFSSYSEKIWNERLVWFELQSEAGLVGEIDCEKTADGTIVCKDGFTATTVSAEQFLELVNDLTAEIQIAEVDGSSLFCIIQPDST